MLLIGHNQLQRSIENAKAGLTLLGIVPRVLSFHLTLTNNHDSKSLDQKAEASQAKGQPLSRRNARMEDAKGIHARCGDDDQSESIPKNGSVH